MNEPRGYSELGRFVVLFQGVEENLNDVIRLLMRAKDEEMVNIALVPYGYRNKLDVSSALLKRFLDCHDVERAEDEFEGYQALLKRLSKLGSRRNALVHSTYYEWSDVDGQAGLLRQNSRLQAKKGLSEEEESLLPDSFSSDFETLREAARELESYRLKIITWVYPT